MSSSTDANGPQSYPTQEDEFRTKEVEAEDFNKSEESAFLEIFQTIPKKSGQKLFQQARGIVDTFNSMMSVSRIQPYEKQEELMSGLKKMLIEQTNVIDAHRTYVIKINPNTAHSAKNEYKTVDKSS
ncbi:MAG: hypothetical protein M3222_01470 [Thermoproteota archaeon]|nr:hypothetical protein [Thermoproteota archaeon]MDQ4023823.1 hypothetical protein [Thermoproteota archaeon]